MGLEMHIQVAASTKLFSPGGVSHSGALPPNSAVDVFDAAMPGALPRMPLPEAIIAGIRFAKACGSGEVRGDGDGDGLEAWIYVYRWYRRVLHLCCLFRRHRRRAFQP